MDWQATGGEKLLQIATRFRFFVYSAFFSSLKYNEHAVKGKKKHKLQHDVATLERAPCWIAVATGNIHVKTSQEQK